MDTATNSEGGKLTTKAGLARRYQVGIRTIDNWRKKRILPFICIGKKCVRFDPIECDAALEKLKVREAA